MAQKTFQAEHVRILAKTLQDAIVHAQSIGRAEDATALRNFGKGPLADKLTEESMVPRSAFVEAIEPGAKITI